MCFFIAFVTDKTRIYTCIKQVSEHTYVYVCSDTCFIGHNMGTSNEISDHYLSDAATISYKFQVRTHTCQRLNR